MCFMVVLIIIAEYFHRSVLVGQARSATAKAEVH